MTSSVRLVTIAIGLAALAALTVGQLSAQTPPQAPSAASAKKPVLKKQRLGSIKQVHALGDIYLTGQPTPNDLALLKGHGIKTIISLRHTKELPWDEATAVRQHGMRFVHVPFQSTARQETGPDGAALWLSRSGWSDVVRLPHSRRQNRPGRRSQRSQDSRPAQSKISGEGPGVCETPEGVGQARSSFPRI